MNNMKNQQRLLADSVGEFIRYWGFRRIHGAIWTELYLNKFPLSGAELVKKLDVSKALISPALSELESWNLIVPTASNSEKTKYYQAVPEIFSVILQVLRQRESVMVGAVKKNLLAVKKSPSPEIDPERLKNLEKMIKAAEFGLNILMKINSFETLLKVCVKGKRI
jgi:DNA-binding transcriptional regulator GbsR (MarR family)